MFKSSYVPAKSYLFFILLGACLLSCCDYKRYRYDFFEGNWVLLNYLDTVQKYRSVARATHLTMQEIVLKRHTDSVCIIDNGAEMSIYPLKRKASNNIVIENYNNNPLDLHMSENADYLKYKKDGRWQVFVRPDNLLVDSSENPSWPVSAQRVVNSIVLGGIYKKSDQQIPVQFYTTGQITGVEGFDHYQVCIGGDCRSFYDGDIVYMTNGTTGAYYTWQWDNRNLSIFELSLVSAPDEKPVYKKGSLVLSLFKVR